VAPLGHQACALERLLDETVRQVHIMIAPGHIAEVADIEARVAIARAVALPAEVQHPLDLRQRDRARRASAAAIEQALVPELFIAQAQAPHRPGT
jgi:hypothetical protein